MAGEDKQVAFIVADSPLWRRRKLSGDKNANKVQQSATSQISNENKKATNQSRVLPGAAYIPESNTSPQTKKLLTPLVLSVESKVSKLASSQADEDLPNSSPRPR